MTKPPKSTEHHLANHGDVNVRCAVGIHVRTIPHSQWMNSYLQSFDDPKLTLEERVKFASWYMGHAEAAGAWG